MDFADLGRPDQYRVEKTGEGESDWKISHDVLLTSESAGGWGPGHGTYAVPSAINAVDWVTQTLRDMQEEMDELQGDLFVANIDAEVTAQNDAERLIEFRTNYRNDMLGFDEEFERFEPLFSFKKPYTSEDPIDSFLSLPSSAALEAFIRF